MKEDDDKGGVSGCSAMTSRERAVLSSAVRRWIFIGPHIVIYGMRWWLVPDCEWVIMDHRFHCRPYHHPWLCSLAICLSGPRRTVISWTEICTIKCCANSVCTSSSGLRYIKEVLTDFPVQRSFRLSVIRFARWTNRSWHRRRRCCIVDTEVTNQPWTIGFHSKLFSGGINRQRGWFVVSLWILV